MLKTIIVIVCLLSALKVIKCYKNYNGYKVYKLNTDKKDLVNIYKFDENAKKDYNKENLDFWSHNIIQVPPEQQKIFTQYLSKNSIEYEILIENVASYVQNIKLSGKKRRKRQNRMAFNYYYYRFNEIDAYLHYLNKEFSNITRLIPIGKSHENRTLNVLQIYINNSELSKKEKPAIFIDGGMHAREWISVATVLHIIQEMVENSSKYYNLLESIDWYFLPVVNPDGYEYTHTNDRFWRKTRSPNPQSTCVGVDINRNFGFHWNDISANTDPCSNQYSGRNAFSEQEAVALANFATSICSRLKLYLSFHSFGQVIFYPWAYNQSLPDNELELVTLALDVSRVLNFTQYEAGSVAKKYSREFSGTSLDWFKGICKVNLSYVIELPFGGKFGFDLPANTIFNVTADIFNGVQVFAEYVRKKYT